MRLLLLSFLLAKGMMPSCSDDVDLGNDVDANVGDAALPDAGTDSGITCADSECGPIPPGLPCGDINAGLSCEATSGSCQWEDHCPADGEDCSAGSCEGPIPTCGAADAAPPARPEPPSVRCIANQRACEWEAPSCECQPEDCGSMQLPPACPDGSAGQQCEIGEAGSCVWVDHCPGEGEECAADACGELPPTLPCSAMMSTMQTGRCIVEAGVCEWEHVACGCEDSFCGERGLAPNCGDTAMPASPGPCERNESATCEWSWLCE